MVDGVVMIGSTYYVAFVSMPGSGEWIVILIIGLLIFGRRLPDVARSLGKSVNEFKKGMREFQDSADEVVRDVNKVTNEVASDVENASGVHDYGGYQDPNRTMQEASPSGSPESSGASDSGDAAGTESADAKPDTVEGGAAGVTEASAAQDGPGSSVEPMK